LSFFGVVTELLLPAYRLLAWSKYKLACLADSKIISIKYLKESEVTVRNK